VDKLEPEYREEETDNSYVTKMAPIYSYGYSNISLEGSRDLSYPDIQNKPSPRLRTLIRLRDVDVSACKEISQPSLLSPSFKGKKFNYQPSIESMFKVVVDQLTFNETQSKQCTLELKTSFAGQGMKHFNLSDLNSLSLDLESSDSDPIWSFSHKRNKPTLEFFSPSSISSSAFSTISPSYSPLPITEVIPGKLFLGCEEQAEDADELLSLGITHILSVTNRINQINRVEHKHFVMSDWGRTNLKTVLDEVYPFMEQSQQPKKKLFVYCKLGQNRSPTLIISFLMKNKGLTLYEAHKLVKESRPVVQIHEKYAKMLLRLEEDLFGETSLPENWMEQEGWDFQRGVPTFVSEEPTVDEQNSFKENQRASKSGSNI